MNQTVVIQFCKKLATRFDDTGNPNLIIVGKFKSIIVEDSNTLLSKIQRILEQKKTKKYLN